ncbi:unnamed protein product [Didymodactylos carnosus]|uniref:Sequestosome-1 n=1 Tax=Didymodactylos carnosus TaxID=1234261 RepID=A0A8S2CZ82_9BILA|nr:unnamed protein product [Didymodactylos carnosus]CAF3558224.1 unnamed protein product [Didymodactylos carnosus]
MTSLIYIKAYYTNSKQAQPEIRRFTIDISPENDIYRDLTSKVATFNPDIQLNGFALQYVDDENERITFSSNDELRSALTTNKDSTLKIFVTPNAPLSPPQQQESTTSASTKPAGECHTGIECNGCEGPIIGVRYKCYVCPDYDLCEECSAKGIHSEHEMIKISKPGNSSNGSPFYHPYFHNGRRHFGGQNDSGNSSPHSHHRRRFWNYYQRPSATNNSTSDQERGTSTTPPPPFMPDPQFFEHIQNQLPQWIPNADNAAHLRAHLQEHFDYLKQNGQHHITNSKHYLENVGKFLQQALSPFGIDCDYSVDEHTKQRQQQQPTTTTTESTELQGQEGTQTTANNNNEMQTENESVPMTKLTSSLSASSATSVPSHEPSAVPKTPVNSELPAHSNNNANGTFSSLLNILRSPSSTSVPPPPKINTMDKQIEDCVERMKAMGFVDTNGVLTDLIRTKQGDINQVLDAINPRHHKN